VTEASDVSPLALTVVAGNPLGSALLAAGHFTVQDVGAQALALLMPPGDLLVDLAAAPGGKTKISIRLRLVIASAGDFGEGALLLRRLKHCFRSFLKICRLTGSKQSMTLITPHPVK
jgi:hypothetical protein